MGRPKKDNPDRITTSVFEPRLDAAAKRMDVGGFLIPVTNTLTALLWGFANHPSPKAKEFYFWRVADLLWNRDDLPEKMFVKHPWAEQIVHECINEKYLAIGGAASCVAGDTRMLNPLTGESPTIQSLCESNTRPWVQTLNGPVLADVPYLKGTKQLFEYKLSNGGSFRCTEDHRLLTPFGWRYAKQTTVGSEIFGYVPCHPPTTSDNALSDPQQGGQRCSEKVADSRCGYRHVTHLGGAQLQWARENARETPPSLGGAQKYNAYVSERRGDPCSELPRSRPYLLGDPSTHSGAHRTSSLGTLWLRRFASKTSSLLRPLFRRHGQSQQESNRQRTSSGPSQRSARRPSGGFCDPYEELPPRADSRVCPLCQCAYPTYPQQGECCPTPETGVGYHPTSSCVSTNDHQSSYGLMVELVQVVSITNVGVHDFYDLNVPVEHHYFAEGSVHHNSGKSHTLAGYGIIRWLSSPKDTLVLFTSTTLREARKRVWGSVISLLSVVEGAPINVRDSIGSANYVDEKGQTFDRAGLSLIAAERSRTREAIGKFIGLKQKHVLLIGDELGELSPAITNAALSNLSKNPVFEFKGASNPASRFDAFGEWSTPKDGWETVTPEMDDEWRTKWGGKYIRLDGERSPNVAAGEVLYPFLPTIEKIAEDKALLGEKSRAYYRMVRAVFFDSDETEGIYSESELVSGGAMAKIGFRGPTTLIAGVDPAFTNGGDRTVMYLARVGQFETGQYGFQFESCISFNDDTTNKAVPRTYQIVHQIRDACIRFGVKPENLAVDATGAGSPFCDVLAGEWSDQFLRVQFGGKASDRRVSMNSKLVGEELYVNRVSELWFVGKEFIRTQQLKGVDLDLAKEMCNRQYEMVKSGTLRVKIESKIDVKARVGASPDLGDAAFITLELARQRHGLVAVDPPKNQDTGFFSKPPRTMRDLDIVSRSHHAQLIYD